MTSVTSSSNVSDLEQGRITESSGLQLLQSLWPLMIARRVAAHEPGLNLMLGLLSGEKVVLMKGMLISSPY